MRILVYTSPARGHLYPVVPIVQELQRRGHELALRTLASQVELVRTLNIDATPIAEQVEAVELDDYRARSVPAKGRRALATFLARAEHEAPDLERAIDAHDPELLLIDVNCWGAATVAEASGRPWAMYCPFLLMLPSRDAPAYGPGLAPPGGPLGRARDRVLRRIWEPSIDRMTVPVLNALRARYALGKLNHFTDLLRRPGVLLSLTAEGFEYPRRDWPQNVRLVGPINRDPPAPPHPSPHPNFASFSRPRPGAPAPSRPPRGGGQGRRAPLTQARDPRAPRQRGPHRTGAPRGRTAREPGLQGSRRRHSRGGRDRDGWTRSPTVHNLMPGSLQEPAICGRILLVWMCSPSPGRQEDGRGAPTTG